MNLTLVVVRNCPACKRAETVLKSIIKNRNDVMLSVKDLNSASNEKVSIVPALFIEDQLYSLGDINTSKLIKELSASHK